MELSLLVPLSVGAAQFCTNAPGSSLRLVSGTVNISAAFNWSVFKWIDYAKWQGGFFAYNFDDIDLVWVPAPPNFQPGEGALIRLNPSPGNVSYCFPQPTHSPVLPLTLVPGINVVCCQSNVTATYEDIVGQSPVPGRRVYQLKPNATNALPFVSDYYNIYTYQNDGWSPTAPIAAPGEAWILYVAPIILNQQIVDGHIEFDVQSLDGYATAVQYSDSLIDPFWQNVTSYIAGPGLTHVIDPEPVGDFAERYYLAKIL